MHLLALVYLLVSTSFMGCSKDDNIAEEEITILGVWNYHKQEIYYNEELVEDYEYEHECSSTQNNLKLFEDGRLEENIYDSECKNITAYGRYLIEGTGISLIFEDDGHEDTLMLEIESLSLSVLRLAYIEDYGDEVYKAVIVFRR